MIAGIDVSRHQGMIDWKKVKGDGIRFAIIKAMKESSRQPDEYFHQNYAGCVENGIDTGVYVYIASKSIVDPVGEALAVLNTIGKRKLPYGVFLDLEDATLQAIGRDRITELVYTETAIYEAAGYHVGIYSNKNWYDKILDRGMIKKFPFWCARYPMNDTGDVVDRLSPMAYSQAWQYSSKGRVNGISGNVDRDIDFVDIPNAWEKFKRSIDDLAYECLKGYWGNGEVRKRNLTNAGYDAATVQRRVNEIVKEV